MAGKFRRKFATIIFDTIVKHYQGKVPEQALVESLEDIKGLVEKLEQSKQKCMAMRMETLKKLKRIPLEKLNDLLASD